MCTAVDLSLIHILMVYHEPYASSSCELVTEMIQYIGEKVKLKSAEADALLAGITVDTQNFSMKTGTINFEAAAFLKRCGADGIRAVSYKHLDVYKRQPWKRIYMPTML